MFNQSLPSFRRQRKSRTSRAGDADLLRHPLRRFVPAERHRIFAVTLILGAACGLAAVSFHAAIRLAEALLIERALGAPGSSWIFWTLVTPTLGACVTGVLLQYVFPEARGSGIPQVKIVYALRKGRMRLRDAFGKFVLGVIQIGTGSALGREGPTVQICAGLATALGRLFALSGGNLRRLVPVGAAAGIAAAFNAPIAAVTFVIEEIIGDLNHTVLSGVVVAAALAAVIERSLLGEHPVFQVSSEYGLDHASSLLIYAAIGCAAALVAHAFYVALLGTRGWFREQSWMPPWLRPSIGGLATGALAIGAVAFLHFGGVNGDGYSTLSAALGGTLGLHTMLWLGAAKFAATVLCYGSGGAGGIFAPVLFIGGMLGGAFGFLDRSLLGHVEDNLGGFALVGMGALFAGVVRAPITSVLIIFEMTNSYRLVLPLMVANSVAFALARRLHATPIYEALIEQDGLRLPHTPQAAGALSRLEVRDAMTTQLVSIPAELTLEQARELVRGHAHPFYPVLEGDGRLKGFLNDNQLLASEAERGTPVLAGNAAKMEHTLVETQPLADAVARMSALGVRQLAVVAAEDAQRLRGILAKSDAERVYGETALAAHRAESPSSPSSHQRRDLGDEA